MSSRLPVDRLPQPGRRTLLLGLGFVVAFLLLGGATATLVLDHPLATVGVGTTPGSSFEPVAEGDRAFVANSTVVLDSSDGTTTRRVTTSRRPNGTVVRSVRTSTNGSGTSPDVSAREAVAFGETGFVRRTYRSASEMDVVEPHVLRRGNRTYVRVDGSTVALRSSSLWYTLIQVSFVRNGSTVRGGESLRVYEAFDRRAEGPPLAASGGASGRVLVDEAGRLRAANVTLTSPNGGTIRVRYDVRLGESRPVPDWMGTARTIPPEPPAPGAGRPSVTAYRSADGLVLVANGSWTPPPDTALVVLLDGGERVRVPLDDSQSVFRPYANGTHVAFVSAADGATVQGSRPADGAELKGQPTRIIVDRRGVNYYHLRVRSTRSLAQVGSVEVAHLRPSNGGGRVLRVPSVSVSHDLSDAAPVTFVVGNGSVRRSVTVSKGELDRGADRVYLVRTPDGIAAMTDPPLSPLNLSAPGEYADRRFVADATLTVVVNGVPVERTRLPKRVTQASDTPRSELLTGISMRLADDPSDIPERYRDAFEGRNWTDHTALYLHNWNYEMLVVSDASDGVGERCLLDYACYYRIEDGAQLRVETGNGTVLFEDTVNGTREVAP